jgi:hypothetical protein
MKIYTLEAQISRYEAEMAELRNKEEGSASLNKQFFSFQVRIDEF